MTNINDYKIVETEKGFDVISPISASVFKRIPKTIKTTPLAHLTGWFEKQTFEKRMKVVLKKIKK